MRGGPREEIEVLCLSSLNLNKTKGTIITNILKTGKKQNKKIQQTNKAKKVSCLSGSSAGSRFVFVPAPAHRVYIYVYVSLYINVYIYIYIYIHAPIYIYIYIYIHVYLMLYRRRSPGILYYDILRYTMLYYGIIDYTTILYYMCL